MLAPPENLPDPLFLNAFPAPVDDADFFETRIASRLQVGLHHLGDILRRESVEIDCVFDGQDEGLLGLVRIVGAHFRWNQKSCPCTMGPMGSAMPVRSSCSYLCSRSSGEKKSTSS